MSLVCGGSVTAKARQRPAHAGSRPPENSLILGCQVSLSCPGKLRGLGGQTLLALMGCTGSVSLYSLKTSKIYFTFIPWKYYQPANLLPACISVCLADLRAGTQNPPGTHTVSSRSCRAVLGSGCRHALWFVFPTGSCRCFTTATQRLRDESFVAARTKTCCLVS